MEQKKQIFKKCEICESQATLFCLECPIYYYCESCYKFVHDKKAKNNHKKEKIDLFIPIEAKCPEHKNVPFNLFCMDEKGKQNILNNKIFYRALLFNVLFYETS